VHGLAASTDSGAFAADLPETEGGKVLKYKLRVQHACHNRDVDP
jgi:hypothetical protein